jgi:hypothetical protein
MTVKKLTKEEEDQQQRMALAKSEQYWKSNMNRIVRDIQNGDNTEYNKVKSLSDVKDRESKAELIATIQNNCAAMTNWLTSKKWFKHVVPRNPYPYIQCIAETLPESFNNLAFYQELIVITYRGRLVMPPCWRKVWEELCFALAKVFPDPDGSKWIKDATMLVLDVISVEEMRERCKVK